MKIYKVKASKLGEPIRTCIYVADSIHKVIAAFAKSWPDMEIHSVKCKHDVVYTA